MKSLLPAPDLVHDRAGRPRFGTYEGAFDSVELGELDEDHALGRVGKIKKHKKWVYVYAASEEVGILTAVVDTSYASTAFTLVADVKTGEVVADRSFMGTPGPLVHVGPNPADGLDCSFVPPGSTTRIRRPRGTSTYRIDVNLRPSLSALTRRTERDGVKINIGLDASSEIPLSVVAPVGEGGRVNVTMKSAALPAGGTVTVGKRTYSMDGGFGGFDYTHGYLARRTAWRWASAAGRATDGTPIAFNMVEGFNEDRDDVNENGLWLGDRLIPLDRARFTYDASDYTKPWHVRTVDGAVDVAFEAIGVHQEYKNLGVITSKFVQPVGSFNGTIRVDGKTFEVADLPGVTEDQDVFW